MHGCSSTSVRLVDAEVDSMGEVVEGGVGITNKTSPWRAAIETVQAELRQECDVREERKRELEFLENGGNPLDFKLGNAASVSVQSTSFTDQHPDPFATSEAKVSFAFTASPHGDSVESSGRPGPPPCEPNSADNLMLFDTEHEFYDGDRTSLHPSKSYAVTSEQSSQMDASHKAMEHGDSAAFGHPRKAYKRRYRSFPNRDGTRSSSTDVNPTCGSHGSSLPYRHGPRDIKGLVSDAENQNTSLNCNSKPPSPIGDTLCKTPFIDGQREMELDEVKAVELTEDLIEGVSIYAASDTIASENPLDDHHKQQSLSGAGKTPTKMDSDGPEAIQPLEGMASAIIDCQQSVTVMNQSSSCLVNGFSSIEGDGMAYYAHNSASCGIKFQDSNLSCTQNSPCIDGKNDREVRTKMRNVDSNGNIKNQTLVPDGAPVIEGDEAVKEKKETEEFESSAIVNEETASACQSQQKNGFALQPHEELNRSSSTLKIEVMDQFNIEETEAGGFNGSESGRKLTVPLGHNSDPQNENSCNTGHQNSIDISISYLPEVASLTWVSTVSLEAQTSSGPYSKLGSRNDEDSILKEAQIIEAKRKRIMELSIATFPVEIRQKSQWDYVLEEMAWLANDFAQERIWKIAVAAQICKRTTFASRLRKQKKSSGVEAKNVAHTLAKAVRGFWHSAEETCKELEQQSQKGGALAVLAYAVRFLKYNNSNGLHSQAEVPLTPDRISDLGILDMSWEDNLTEENLFYTVPPGAMETYRKSIESHVAQRERIGSSVQEEVETSACDAAADFDSQDDVYDEDEEEMSTYDMSMAFEGSDKSSRFGQKKRKQLMPAYGARSCHVGSDLLAVQYADNKFMTSQSALLVKRPGSSLNVSIPTKRVRTASRRVISPFTAGTSGCIQGPNKTDASSGDTSSFQDDHSTLKDGSLVPNNLEAELVGEFEKQLPFDSAEVSTKFKKKKPKHLNAMYKHRWQVDSSFQNEQRDHLKKGPDSYQLESNGSSGLLGSPLIKKQKMRQSHDNSFDNITPIGGSITSPVASQMSNMSNPNKFGKVIGGRDRGRKPKVLKMPAGQPGSGSPWSLFEDQALVVLVHDMGPNWELISDAMNGTSHFKCIFRKPKECKERHHLLMDGSSGDGADSADDSGVSQPYPSTLPGIPKGSARQLFQRLQGPMEEDTLNSHFDKIIMIGQKQHYRKIQDPKQLQQPHSSHTIALSQVCPNNLNGGPILTPLDLCDDAIAEQDILSLGYQVPHSSVLSNPNQGTVSPMLSASGTSSALQGSSNMMLGTSFSSSSGTLNSSVRDGRYGVPRSASISIDEQQRMQQYSQMISGRSIPQHNMSAPGALSGTDRGVRILPGGNGLGMVGGGNRSIPMARPGFQGIASSSMVNSGSMVSPGMASTNMHSGVGSGQGSSLLRPHEALHLMRPGMSQDSQRQMMVPDLQIQVSPGNSQGVLGGLSSPFPYQTASPPVSSYPLHHQQSHPISPQQPQVLSPRHSHFQGPANHGPNPQQQAYTIRLAQERQLQQRFLQQQPQQQQQQQFAASNSLMPHVQSQTQLPTSSPVQNSSQVHSQANSPPVSLSPLTSASSMNSMPQHQQKHHTPTQGGVRNAQIGGSGLTNQTGKHRQRQQQPQQLSQANRQHPQQRQQSQSQQQAKVLKGVGRGDLMLHQNIPIDPSLLNGVSTSSGNQCSEKGEPATHLMQSQGLYSGSTINAVQPTRQYVSSQSSNQSLPQQKVYSGQASSSLKHLHQMTSHADNRSQGHVSAVTPTGLSAAQQSVPLAMAGSNHQQAPPHQKLVNQNQLALQRVVQPNRQINTDPSNKPQVREFDTDQNPTSTSTEIDTMTAMDSNALNSETNLSSLASTITNSSESVPQAGQGLGQRPSSASFPPTRHDVSAQWQQQPLHVQQSQSPAPQPQHPPPQQQQPLLPLHSQQQAQLLQAGSGNLFGRSGDPRLE